MARHKKTADNRRFFIAVSFVHDKQPLSVGALSYQAKE